MRGKKAVLIIVGWAVLVTALLTCLQIAKHPGMRRLRENLKDKFTTIISNFSDRGLIWRRRPITTIDLEENLKVNLAVPFREFSEEDWDWFWELMYEKYPKEGVGWLKRKRQLDRQEIESILTNYYYQPFGSFREEQWGIFWQHILKGRVFGERGR
jgi:hypothetical protein